MIYGQLMFNHDCQACSVNFRKDAPIPKKYRDDSHDKLRCKSLGSPAEKICRWFQGNDELVSVQQLVTKMKDLLPVENEPHGNPHMLQKLKKHFFGNNIVSKNDEMPNMVTRVKPISIGQALVQASRPRSLIIPILFDIGGQLHRDFGSHLLIDELHRLEFCVSYDEAKKYLQSGMMDMSLNFDVPPSPFCQLYKEEEIARTLKKRKLEYFGYVMRGRRYSLLKLITEGKIIGRKRISWLRNLREWFGLTSGQLFRIAADKVSIAMMIANLRYEMKPEEKDGSLDKFLKIVIKDIQTFKRVKSYFTQSVVDCGKQEEIT
ncbi:hypothetical protein ILUMI_07088 [Ignelater luminosus]|uniref:Uncharacterized protein n=1 Tax=Ignelater luminosus TaxID=2038154 RepID=A0A8K0GBX9_IGNLU|nr:hypothetical protein ILUMI_07088 [Ignelater luminosus]